MEKTIVAVCALMPLAALAQSGATGSARENIAEYLQSEGAQGGPK